MNRKIIVVLLLFFMALGALFWMRDLGRNNFEKERERWYRFEEPSGKFSVLFPTLPQLASELFNDPRTKEKKRYEMYVSEEDDGTVYMISLITFSKIDSQIKKDYLLETVVSNIKHSDQDNEITEENKTTYHGDDALDFTIQNPEFRIEGKAFLHENTLLVLTMVTKEEKRSRAEFDAFFSSFELSPQLDKLEDRP